MNIAFIGKAGAGKTTCAELLIKHFGYERLSFAEPLKIGCGTRTDRGLLQRVGCGVRDLHADFWVNLLMHDMEQRGLGDYCIDDARFYNEVTELASRDFAIVRVTAPKSRRIDRLRINGKLQDEAQLDHISETELDDFPHDFRIVNDGWPDSMLGALTQILNNTRDL